MKQYAHIFFDLDHTLWDFEKNSHQTISELFVSHKLNETGISSADKFISVYIQVNEVMWEQYRLGKISKDVLRTMRFSQTLSKFGITDNERLSRNLADDYVEISPYKKNLFAGAIDVLEFLSVKYKLHIITNGFPEVQHKKMASSGLDKYFKNIFISEEVGYSKPKKEIFDFAMKTSGAESGNSIMIGDNMETDVLGALGAGMDSVWFNPDKKNHKQKPTLEISALSELKKIF